MTLTILGATGYTGRLCAAEAVRRGLPVRLGGRRRGALEELADSLGTDDIAVADAHDPAALAALAASTDVLLSCVGPYQRHGRPVVEAALTAGCHYLDVTGEVGFVAWVRDQHARAASAGVALLPAVGFDGVPGDLLAAVAAAVLDRPVAEARAAYLVRNTHVSAGTAQSVVGIAGDGGMAWIGGRLRQEPVAASHWRVPFPEPLGPRGAVSAPIPDAVTLGPTTGADVARGYFVVPAARLATVLARPFGIAAAAVASTPVRSVLERLASRLPAGPDEDARAATRAAVLAEVRGGGATARAWCTVQDMYGVTAAIAVSYAANLLSHGPQRPGVLTPAQAAETPEGVLDEHMLRWAVL